jgi:1-acyl-sn-glycerol-3-phosphate acyltransferase
MPTQNPDQSQEVVERLFAIIHALVQEMRAGSRVVVSLDSSLERDLGLDSLTRVELIARAEKAFGVRLPETVLNSADTPRDLLEALAEADEAHDPAAWQVKLGGQRAEAGGIPEQAVTLLEVLDWHLAHSPDREHVLFYHGDEETESMSYRQLADAASRVAGALSRRGVLPGHCVGLMLPSGLDFFRCFLGILFAGAVPVPMYPPARPSQIEDHMRRQAGILVNCEASLLITFDRIKPLAGVLQGLVPTLQALCSPADLLGGTPALKPQARDGDLALIQYTSGSTGNPKGVELSHANLLANIRAWGSAVELDSSDVCVSWLPLYHDMGLIGAWLGSLYHAIPLVLMSPLDFLARPERWLWAIHRHRGTVTAAPNFAFDLCVKRLADSTLDGMDLSSWRLAANGAEPVSPESMSRFAAVFAERGFRAESLAPVYGLAECTVGLAVPRPGRGVRIEVVKRNEFVTTGEVIPAVEGDQGLQFVSCGMPLPGHEVRIVNDAGVVQSERRVGQLEFRGPSATRGYHRNPEANAGLFHDGWLVSGDYAFLSDGEIFITGRSKDMIVRGGRNFYPYELEHAVGDLPGVRKGCVAVFGALPLAGAGVERLVVVAETRLEDTTGRDALERDIVALSADLLGLPPDEVVLVPPQSVLKTSSGKIRRADIRSAWLAGTLGDVASPAWRQGIRLGLAGLLGRLGKTWEATLAHAYGAWAWSCFGVLAATGILALIMLPTPRARWRVCHRLARALARLTGCRLEVSGLEHLDGSPCVIVANHASYIDGFVLVAALPEPVRFVAKAELGSGRGLRWLFERLDTEFVERFETGRSVSDAKQLAGRATLGAPLLFFAEGTFTPQSGLRPFRLGAFHVAVENGLDVVPIAIKGSRAVLRAETWLPRRGALAVTVEQPQRAQGEDWRAASQLRDRVRGCILEHCGESSLDNG